jgi:ankyrin repeat protein
MSDINDTLVAGISPLHFTAFSGNLDGMGKLVDAGALMEEKTHEGWNALMISAQEGHLGTPSSYAPGLALPNTHRTHTRTTAPARAWAHAKQNRLSVLPHEERRSAE